MPSPEEVIAALGKLRQCCMDDGMLDSAETCYDAIAALKAYTSKPVAETPNDEQLQIEFKMAGNYDAFPGVMPSSNADRKRLGGPHHPECRCKFCVKFKIDRAASLARVTPEAYLNTIRNHLQTMIASAEVYVDGEDTITGYRIKTGALHRVIGMFSDMKGAKPLHIPTGLPVASDARPSLAEEGQSSHLATTLDESTRVTDAPVSSDQPAAAWAVFGPDGKVWVDTVAHNPESAWPKATVESSVRPAQLKKDGYTCREVVICPSADGVMVMPCDLTVGAVHFHAGIKVSLVQGCIDRLYARYRELSPPIVALDGFLKEIDADKCYVDCSHCGWEGLSEHDNCPRCGCEIQPREV